MNGPFRSRAPGVTVLTPSDFPFSGDDVLAEGNPNQEMIVVGELNLRTIPDTRSLGTVLPLVDLRAGIPESLGHAAVIEWLNPCLQRARERLQDPSKAVFPRGWRFFPDHGGESPRAGR